jgi:predicted CopG family antitoxin
VEEQGVDVTRQLKVSDAVYDDLDKLKDEEGHTSFDSVLRTLLLHYRYVQPNESEE